MQCSQTTYSSLCLRYGRLLWTRLELSHVLSRRKLSKRLKYREAFHIACCSSVLNSGNFKETLSVSPQNDPEHRQTDRQTDSTPDKLFHAFYSHVYKTEFLPDHSYLCLRGGRLELPGPNSRAYSTDENFPRDWNTGKLSKVVWHRVFKVLTQNKLS